MRYRCEPAIFASAPCYQVLASMFSSHHVRWHLTSAFSQRLRKYTFTAVHTKTHKRRFQIYPLWRAFSNLCVYGERFHRLRVDGRPKRTKRLRLLAFAFTIVFVWTGPKFPDEQHFVNKTVKFAAALLKHVKLAAFQFRETTMMFSEMVSNWWVFMFNDALVKVSGCHSNIICITQITFKYLFYSYSFWLENEVM